MFEDLGEKMKLKWPGKQNSWQQVKHAGLYSDPPQALEGRAFDKSAFSFAHWFISPPPPPPIYPSLVL